MKSVSICILFCYLALCSRAGERSAVVADYGKLPLGFEANTGQADNSVKFLSRGTGYGLYLTTQEAVLALRKGGKQSADVVRMRLAGASGTATPAGEEQLPGTANYFIGNDPAKWHSSVPTYAKVRYRGVYPGVDLVYYGNQRQLEYDFIVAPGIDPKLIRLQFAGTKGLRLGADGDLAVTAAAGAMTFHKPLVYQLVDGQRKTVEGAFALLARHTVGFRLGSYDRAKPLVIDPVLAYSTYLGGSGGDGANAVAVDTAGNVYVGGYTSSTDFPVAAGEYQNTDHEAVAGAPTAFIAKLNPAGTALVYSTYLGGSNGRGDFGYGDTLSALAVDGSGNAYAAGTTAAGDFPVTQGAFQTKNRAYAVTNAFIAKLNPTGTALVYSTYLGGSGAMNLGVQVGDTGNGLAVDSSGNAYVTGMAWSKDFPVTAGAFQTMNRAEAGQNAFVSKLNPAGTALVYSTYLGGGLGDWANALAVDGAGNAYTTGLANSSNFPVTPGAFQTANRATIGGTAFVTKLNPAGSALVYSTYLGGSLSACSSDFCYYFYQDEPYGLAVDGSGNAYVVGSTLSTDFPVTPGAFQTTNPLATAFVTKLNPAGSGLAYSTFLGGGSWDSASSLVVDSSGNAYIVGSTLSTDFPVTPGAFQTTYPSAGNGPAFVTKLNPAGSALVYSTFLGGSNGGAANGVALDGSGNAYVVGSTSSTDFPTTSGAFQTVNHGAGKATNAFVTKLALGSTTPSITAGGIVPVDSNVGTIQPGEWVSIFGSNLAGSTVTWNQDFPQTLGGTTVTIDGRKAYLWYVSPGQINLQAPDDSATGTVPVVVTTANGSATANVTLAAYAPSLLLLDAKHVAGIILRSNGTGAYGGGSYDIIGPTGTSLGYPTVAAKAGDMVELYGTGFGPTTPAVLAGQAFTGAAATANVSVIINSQVRVTPAFAGLSGAGLEQINLTIPSGLGTGDVPLVATVGGVQTPSYVVISLQ
jgi:uncharacterized protein (TIGR03437 family)